MDILDRHQIPAIINTASGGLIEPTDYNKELIHFVNRIPYDWILPKVYAIMHHGGSGTTHLALKYGCASMVIPHIIDQFVWNRLVAQKGAGPKGPKIATLSRKNLEPKLLDLFTNQAYKTRAREVAKEMAKEQFEDKLCDLVLQ